MDNPLLHNGWLPPFSAIGPEHVVPAIDHILVENRKLLRLILRQNTVHTWDTLAAPLEEMQDRLNRCWSPVSHLHSVADNPELREAYNACLPKLSDYATEILQNHDLYLAYRLLSESDHYKTLCPAQRKIIDNTLRDFRLSGVTLAQKHKEEFKRIELALSEQQSRFEENVLDATHAWNRHITDEKSLAGLPQSAIDLAAHNAEIKGRTGWLFTLDLPSYFPVMQYAEDAALREEMYTAYVTRASDRGPVPDTWDNSGMMGEILSLRGQKARLLGFASYAHYSLARKMANSPDEVLSFLNDLCKRSRPVASEEFAELTEFARDHYRVEKLHAWDVAFYSEKLREHKFDFSQEQLKPYFPVPSVLAGLFALMHRLFGLDINEKNGVDCWHPDVRFFEITDREGTPRGGFYLDLYAREKKRGGAWMDECVTRKKSTTQLQLPVAYLNCNFTPPTGNKPSLLTHDDVTTLFHEFGHGLHHMLTLIDFPGVAGINGVPWDAVELPSQLLENWCWERESLDLLTAHYQTGEPLPEGLYRKMLRAKNFQSGMQMVRQLEFALFDFRLHLQSMDYDPGNIQQLLDAVRQQTAVLQPPEFNRFQHSFAHIFAGGYAAGYYSYKWAEVLSADAFSKFEENGIFDEKTGEDFLHTILEQGGSTDPMDLFIRFRGRKPDIASLLRHSGIETQSTIPKI